MYLSRLQLNNRNRTVTDQPYKLHQLVMSGFPDGVTREKANVLHRLDLDEDNAILLVQSDVEPDWGKIHPDLLLPASPFDPIPNPAVREISGVNLPNGRFLQFRLTANPTIKKVRRDDQSARRNSNRVPLVREDQQVQWLADKGKQHGFRLLHVTISSQQKQKGRKKGQPQGQSPLTLYTVQFNGRLQITDLALFYTALRQGIGPAKAFGCGLLSLAPA